MKVLIFGSKGYLGRLFVSVYGDAICPDTDIADSCMVAKVLDAERPDFVINCAGKTGRPNVDWCEDHKEETVRGNVTGPLVLLSECAKRSIYWVHIGSGCMYEGGEDRPFAENDAPNFMGSFYSKTKVWSDQVLQEFPVLLLRIRMPFDGSQDPRNLLTKIRGYTRVLDVKNSLTYLPDFLSCATQLIERRMTGPFNIVNPGAISPYEIMQRYQKIVDPNHKFERLDLSEMADVAKAPRSNCVLSTAKMEAAGIRIQNVDSAVKMALEQHKQEKGVIL